MSARLEKLFRRTPGQRRTRIAIMLAGVIVVPLAIAGLVSGALASADERLDTVPAIVVNNDEMITATLPDGSEQMILAGRQLVTELTGPDMAGFEWTISNSEQAADALAAGDAYAVLTIPSDFSSAINSLSGDEPTQADLQIRTDDAHAYLAGSAAQSVGEAMTSAFGREITTQYLTAFYSGIAEMGDSLGTAADGADTLAGGVGTLATGLDSLAGGATTAASGAGEYANGVSEFAGGVTSYTQGVDGIAGGLGTLNQSAAQLTQLSDGVKQYTDGISGGATQLSAGLGQGIQALELLLPTLAPEQVPAAMGALEAMKKVQAGADQLVGSGDQLASQTATAIGGVQGGISQLAGGAAQLSAGSDGLRGGANALAGGASELAGGVSQLAEGAGASASGAHQLQEGASSLATGLGDGAEQASALGGTDPKATAEVIAEPVGVSLERDNEIATLGEIIGMVFVPVGLWIGALAIFLLMRPVSAIALGSTAPTARIVGRGLLRGFAIAAAQVLVIVALLHTTLGVSWSSLPATLGFSLLIAAAFVAVHHLLVTGFGRVGVVISLVLLAVQLTSAGGLYPVEIVAAPFQAISPFLPLTWAVQGMQAIVAGVGGSAVGTPAVVLALFAVISATASLAVVARRRGARSFAFALAQS
ncbi:putative membrane protein [Microterricola gilva]|uniref:Putative membrane protein n=1 Tax=Microterricola gilva TaxID=393267 RepID=A0A4Q8AJH6_9MICO|nr:YhgE/Pip domain-containing protein [Microterricola gilva]RZU64627.1 putative membrane protein [Microterricola gilva]